MNIKWKPQGKIIARGEDGVPWELYENGYFLFKPTKEKNTLSNRRRLKGGILGKKNMGTQLLLLDLLIQCMPLKIVHTYLVYLMLNI